MAKYKGGKPEIAIGLTRVGTGSWQVCRYELVDGEVVKQTIVVAPTTLQDAVVMFKVRALDMVRDVMAAVRA